jgi:hypothetical protein
VYNVFRARGSRGGQELNLGPEACRRFRFVLAAQDLKSDSFAARVVRQPDVAEAAATQTALQDIGAKGRARLRI